jgi:hypothetical protein
MLARSGNYLPALGSQITTSAFDEVAQLRQQRRRNLEEQMKASARFGSQRFRQRPELGAELRERFWLVYVQRHYGSAARLEAASEAEVLARA